MSDPIEQARDRFAMLAEIYGADRRRWPAADRAAFEDLPARDQADMQAILACEERLDARLDAYPVASPSAALIGRILAAAPQPQQFWSRVRLWWSVGLLLSTGLAGGISGALVLTLAAPALERPAAEWVVSQTIFGAIDLDGLSNE